MKRFIFAALFFTLTLQSGFTGEKNRFFQMTNQEIDSLLTVTSRKSMTITERMNYYSRFFLGTDYSWVCTGDGPYALLEAYPLVNFKQTNCMVFCEHVLALAISDSWDNFFNNLQQIRYRDGIIGMRTRNHYTMADWLPENRWLLTDVSRTIGGKYVRTLTRTISHKKFFRGKGVKDLRYVKPDRKLTVAYVLSGALLKIKTGLKPGDIGAILFANKKDIFSAHMFIVVKKDGVLTIRESSTSKMSTFDTPFEKWATKIAASKRYAGASFMRVRADLNQPGKIILPWNICGMRQEMNEK